MTTTHVTWLPFECDGRSFEYLAMHTKTKSRPALWPSHEASPCPWVPTVLVIVRKPGDATGPAMVFPAATNITTEHALETARTFWDSLTK